MRKSGSFALMQNVSIRTRVFGGFGVVLALLATLAFVAQRALAVVETEACESSRPRTRTLARSTILRSGLAKPIIPLSRRR